MDDIDYYCIAISNDSSSCEWKELTIREKMASSIIADYSELEERRNERYLFLKDEAGNISVVNSNSTDSIIYDISVPQTILSTTGNLKSTSQTVTLTCRDDGNIDAYYWGTTEPTEASDLTTTTGLSSLGTGLNKTVSTAGTYYFAVKSLGLEHIKSADQVIHLLIKIQLQIQIVQNHVIFLINVHHQI
jgi:hypothetical protein